MLVLGLSMSVAWACTWHDIGMSLAWACAWYDNVLGLSYTLHCIDRLELGLGLSMSYRIEYKLGLSIWLGLAMRFIVHYKNYLARSHEVVIIDRTSMIVAADVACSDWSSSNSSLIGSLNVLSIELMDYGHVLFIVNHLSPSPQVYPIFCMWHGIERTIYTSFTDCHACLFKENCLNMHRCIADVYLVCMTLSLRYDKIFILCMVNLAA